MKIHTKRLKDSKWNLEIDIHKAKLNGEIITLAESTVLRMIDEINGIDSKQTNSDVKSLQKQLRIIKKEPKSAENVKKIKEIYAKLHEIQYCPEYLCLVCDTAKDYRRACKGFTINGMKYRRLLGTAGSIKKSTIVFVSEYARSGILLYDDLVSRIENGRNMNMEFVPAKLEAYKALVCSASSPVSWPNGILVVKDCVTHFKDDYLLLDDSSGEPVMTDIKQGDVELNASDGYGLISPALDQRWSEELGLDYLAAGMCVRNSFTKGMTFAFDFHRFADEVSHKFIVEDIWGNEIDIRNVEMILTESMLKLWDSYQNLDEYISNCKKNGYAFSVTKATPNQLESERRLNYQFLQSFKLTNEQIWELIEPTCKEISDAMGEDVNSSILFLRGKDVNEHNVDKADPDFVMALMADERMINDPYVRSRIRQLIKKKITEAKFGKIKCHANFSIISGDPYALCQSVFSLPVTGLLKAGQVYNKYWSNYGAPEGLCFRAPMSSHRNIRRVQFASGGEIDEWFKYMDTVTILNAWDTITIATNGSDFDSDSFMITDNKVLLDSHEPLSALMCIQRKAKKMVPSEYDFVEANILGFGDEIGTITNRITSQYEVQAGFADGSLEYEELDRRIITGQNFQQNSIDRLKGIITSDMPEWWYKPASAKETGNPIDIEIVADKKPYFMMLRYQEDSARIKQYDQEVENACIFEYDCTFRGLSSKAGLTEDEENFISWYYKMRPYIDNGGMMNRLCHMTEDYFLSWKQSTVFPQFDYEILKSDCEYSNASFTKIKTAYGSFIDKYNHISKQARLNKESDGDVAERKQMALSIFDQECSEICPNENELCNIVIDLLYATERSKMIAWNLCGDMIVNNLLARNGWFIKYLEKNQNGQVYFGGDTFIEKRKYMRNEDE